MTRDELVAKVRLRPGIRDGDGLFTADVLASLVDEANAMLEAERDWPWRVDVGIFDTEAGEARYYLPGHGAYDFYDEEYPDDYGGSVGSWLRTLSVRIEGYEPMIERALNDLEFLDPTSASGTPSVYAVAGDFLYLAPTPAAVHRIHHRFVTVAPPLDDGASEPLMPEMFQWAIVAQAASLAFTRAGDDGRAAQQELAVERWRQRMTNDQRRSRGPIRARIRPGAAI